MGEKKTVRFKRVAYLFFFVSLGIIASSCTNRPKEVLSKKKMERLMYDVYVAEAVMENDYGSFNTSEKKEALIDRVFRKNGVTEAQWDSSLSWYSDRIDVYIKMNDSVKARLQREQRKIDAQIAQQYAREQEMNRRNRLPSYIPSAYAFGIRGEGTGFTFRLDTADINKHAGDQDNIDFRFRIVGLPQQNMPRIRAMLVSEYKDTTVYAATSVQANQPYSITASRYIANDTLRHVTGFVHLEDKASRAVPEIQVYNISFGKRSQPKVQPEQQPPSDRRPRVRDGEPAHPDTVGGGN